MQSSREGANVVVLRTDVTSVLADSIGVNGTTRSRLCSLRLIVFLFAMGFFSSLFGCRQAGGDGRFQTDKAYAENRALQLAMTPRTLAELRTHGVTDETHLKLEYFFYTNTKEKAAALAQRLANMGYTGSYHRSVDDPRPFLITGWTSPMKMDDRTVLDWTGRMCDAGREDDCEFDGWGTYPEQ